MKRLLLIGLAAISVLGMAVFLLPQMLPSDPAGPESAFGRQAGNVRVANELCSNEYYTRVSIFSDMGETPRRASLLWEVKDPIAPDPGNPVIVLGSEHGFSTVTKRLTTELPKKFQIEFETNLGGLDAYGVLREWFSTLPDDRWFDGDDEVSIDRWVADAC